MDGKEPADKLRVSLTGLRAQVKRLTADRARLRSEVERLKAELRHADEFNRRAMKVIQSSPPTPVMVVPDAALRSRGQALAEAVDWLLADGTPDHKCGGHGGSSCCCNCATEKARAALAAWEAK